jgi:hypothetical protein
MVNKRDAAHGTIPEVLGWCDLLGFALKRAEWCGNF